MALASGRSEPEPTVVGSAAEAVGDPDCDLVARAKTGDRAAFEALLRAHYDRMHRIAWRMTGSRQDAEDIVQETCCGLAAKLDGFRGQARFSTWLYGIVANACRDHHRRGASLARLREGLAIFVRGAGRTDEGDPYGRVWLGSALAKLEPALRETIVLVAGEGLTHAEAGAALGIAENTVSWRLFEARRRLKLEFGGERPDV